MAKAKRERHVIMCRKEPGGRLSPLTPMDAEEIDRIAPMTTVRVEPASDRAHDQLATYWFVLSEVTKATGRWPSKEHLHEAIKWDLKRVSIAYNMIGMPRLVTDSIGIDAMSDADRRDFIDEAFALIQAETGVDPGDVIAEAKRRSMRRAA